MFGRGRREFRRWHDRPRPEPVLSEQARQLQQERLGQRKLYCNAQLSSRDLQEFCRLSAGSQLLLRQAITRFKLSPRAYDRILKVARTIADLAGCVDIRDEHIFEAINYRRKEQ